MNARPSLGSICGAAHARQRIDESRALRAEVETNEGRAAELRTG